MGKMGGRVGKGKWALKHSLRSQFVPIAPTLFTIGENAANSSIAKVYFFANFAV
jgi:hypothetical protein